MPTKLEVSSESVDREFLLVTGSDAKQILLGSWKEKSECHRRGIPFEWFYNTKKYKQVAEACEVCTVRSECLEFVLITHEQHGFWAGYTSNQRKPIYKRWLAEHVRRGTFPPGNHMLRNYRPHPLDRKIFRLIYKSDNHRLTPDSDTMMNFLAEMLGEKKTLIASRLTALERQGFISKKWATKRRILAIELTGHGLDLINADPSFINI